MGDSLLPSAIADMLLDLSFHTVATKLIGRSATLMEALT